MTKEERMLEIDNLMRYLDLLRGLNESGYHCSTEIEIALSRLNKIMTYDNSTKVDIKKMFEYAKKEGRLAVVNNSHRKAGKTTLLIQEAIYNKYTLVVSSSTERDLIRNNYPEVNVISAYEIDRLSRGRKVLIDCTVSIKDIQKIRDMDIKIIGGFHNNNLLSW